MQPEACPQPNVPGEAVQFGPGDREEPGVQHRAMRTVQDGSRSNSHCCLPLFPTCRPRTSLPDSPSACPPCRRQPLISPPLILPVPLLLPRLPALRASHRVGRGSLARCAAVGALVMAKLHLQIHGPPPLRVRRLQIDGSIDEIRSGLDRMTSCCRATKFPARFLSISAIRLASHRALEAVPRSTTG